MDYDSPEVLASALLLYIVAVVGIGLLATRRSSGSPKEYFLAGKGLGTLVLFMALFGTNCTAFVLVGVPGLAYHDGIAVFGLNAAVLALGVPLTFWMIGSPARRMARRLGAMTPAELYAKRFDSKAVGYLLFAVFTLYTIPYMASAVAGAAQALGAAFPGRASVELFGAGVLAVALLYTSLGGMRATAWTNVLQGALFLGFMILVMVLVPRSMGGWDVAMEKVQAFEGGRLLRRPDKPLYQPAAFATWGLTITVTVIAFPHMLVRMFTAKDEGSLRKVARIYPVALLLLWLPAVLLGVWGAVEAPGLEGKASDQIFAFMTDVHMPPVMGIFGFLAVIAAVMSTLDAQLLTLGSMLVRDVLPGRLADDGPRQVWLGRGFGVLVAVAVYLVWQGAGTSIFGLASISFSGYVTLAPLLLMGVRSRRCTTSAAIASVLVGNVAYFLALTSVPDSPAPPALTPTWWGWVPGGWGFGAALVTILVVPTFTRSNGAATQSAFGDASSDASS